MDKKILGGPGTVIGANVKLVGTIHDANEIVVHGKIEGEVVSDKLVNVTETAFVKGPISSESVQISGKVDGSITASGKLEIMPSGRVHGSITTKNLSIHSGAVFVGKSMMPSEGKFAEEGEVAETEPEEIEEEVKN